MPNPQPVTAAQCDRCHVSITGGDRCVDCAIDASHEAERETMWKGYVTRSYGECDDDEVPQN